MIAEIFLALTGVPLSILNVLGLVAFFWIGRLFGKLTLNISFLKIAAAIVVGSYLYTLLQHVYGAMILTFFLGVVSQHISFTWEAIMWAEDLEDFWYALQNREAYEDIRQEEPPEREWAGRGSWTEGSAEDERTAQGDQEQSGRAQREQSHRTSEDKSKLGSKSDASRSPYETMGLDPHGTYTKSDLKRAYRKQAMKVHPDTGGSAEAFRELTQCYERLLRSATS